MPHRQNGRSRRAQHPHRLGLTIAHHDKAHPHLTGRAMQAVLRGIRRMGPPVDIGAKTGGIFRVEIRMGIGRRRRQAGRCDQRRALRHRLQSLRLRQGRNRNCGDPTRAHHAMGHRVSAPGAAQAAEASQRPPSAPTPRCSVDWRRLRRLQSTIPPGVFNSTGRPQPKARAPRHRWKSARHPALVTLRLLRDDGGGADARTFQGIEHTDQRLELRILITGDDHREFGVLRQQLQLAL